MTSVFDLSPSEKLQLVEDLWDDLAAQSLDAVPNHEWEMEEVARREANLRKHPASGFELGCSPAAGAGPSRSLNGLPDVPRPREMAAEAPVTTAPSTRNRFRGTEKCASRD